MSTPLMVPTLPQQDPISEKTGLLTLPWNMFFVELLRYIQANTNAISALELGGSGAGGGVATAGAWKASDLTTTPSAEGTLNLGARADHKHQVAIQAESDTASLGLVQAVNAQGPFLYAQTEVDAIGTRASVALNLYALEIFGGL